jgi:arginase
VLLGCLAATRERHGSVALLMADGHEDCYPPHSSLTGEAADCELYIALGLPSQGLPEPIGRVLPLLSPDQVVLLGPRDEATIVRDGAKPMRGTVAIYSDEEVIARGANSVAAQAAQTIASVAAAWWLHVDLDVLASDHLDAVDYPQPGGLSWEQLGTITRVALQTPRCAGWTVAIYNPDLDPQRTAANDIVNFIAAMADVIPTGVPNVTSPSGN